MPGEAALATQAIGTVTGLVQTIGGLVGAGKANKQLNRLFKQRKAFQTPTELFDLVNAQQMNAGTGYSPQTLDYLTSNADAGLSSTLGSATKLGADPNQLSGVLDSYFRDIFKIGGENELVKMKKFDGFLNALQLLSQNKEAEQISKDNLVKDQMQAQADKLRAANQNIQSGINLLTNSASSFATSGLYGNNRTGGDATGGDPVRGSGGSR